MHRAGSPWHGVTSEVWGLVGGGVVLGEEVSAEVAFGVAPDGVDVVRVVLGVVVLDEQVGALDAVVVLLAYLEAAGPDEGEGGRGDGLDAGEFGGGDLVRHAGGVLAEERIEGFALGSVEGIGGEADGGCGVDGGGVGGEVRAVRRVGGGGDFTGLRFAPDFGGGGWGEAFDKVGAIAGDEVGRGDIGEDGEGELFGGEAADELAAEVFFGGEGAELVGADTG